MLVAGGVGATPILTMVDHLRDLVKGYAIHYCGGSRELGLSRQATRYKSEQLHVYARDEGQRLRAVYHLAALIPDRLSAIATLGISYAPKGEFKTPGVEQARLW